MDTELPFIVRFPNLVRDQPTPETVEETSPRYNQDHWFYALREVRKALFTTTSATVSSPFKHLSNYEKKTNTTLFPPSYYQLFADIDREAATFSFNSETFAAHDIYIYRQLRSEHVVMRMAHQIYSEELTYTFCRISRGIFLVQKYDNSAHPAQENTIETLTFINLYQDMMQQSKQQQPIVHSAFRPFTYTLGVRYTNPYENARDLVIRGNIPLWCQTLFVTECMRQLPILPNTTVTGLLPFLRDMEFHFTSVPEMYPEMTVMFERFAMELSEPYMVYDYRGDAWDDIQKKILNSIAFCDLSDKQASIITSAANTYARAQGLLLSQS